MKIQLKKAIMHKGEELKELDLSLDRLTGNDLIEVEEQAIKAGNNAFSATDFSRVYLIAVAARAMKRERLQRSGNGSAKFFAELGLRRERRGRNPGDAPRNILRRIAVRLARADTGTPVTEWLKVPVHELPEWYDIVRDEAEKLERELEKRQKKGR